MNPRVAPLADLYNLNTNLVNKTLENLSDDVAHKRVNDTGTSLHWIIGHITNSRHYVGGLFKAGTQFEKSDLFNGGIPIKEPSEYPSITEIKKTFEDVSEKFMKRLEELTDDDINKKLENKLPVDDDTMLAAISFFSLHESYHVGQLSYIRRQLGMDGLTG